MCLVDWQNKENEIHCEWRWKWKKETETDSDCDCVLAESASGLEVLFSCENHNTSQLPI